MAAPIMGLANWATMKVRSLATQPLVDSPTPRPGQAAQKTAATAKPNAATTTTAGQRTAASLLLPQGRQGVFAAREIEIASFEQPPPREVAGLVSIMEEQVSWDWDRAPLTQPNAAIALAMQSKTLGETAAKADIHMPQGDCYKSVKLGLWRARYVAGFLDDIAAKDAAWWLPAVGFRDVTHSLPDARWAWPGDIIVYRYPKDRAEANDRKRAEALARYEQAKAEHEAKRNEYERARQEHDSAKTHWEREHPGQRFKPSLAVKSPQPPRQPTVADVNYGHIDVRTYDGYLSDFRARADALPNAAGPKGLEVIGIFRHISDPLPDLRLRAFLKVLREWECHEEPDDAQRYFVLGMGLKINGSSRFMNTSTHPFEGTEHETKKLNPAGAYQVILGTYRGYLDPRFGLQPGFAPLHQDRIAVAIIEASGALGEIRTGQIEQAVRRLNRQWSSLPGTMDSRRERRGGGTYTFTVADVLARHREYMAELL